ncbi:MAG: PQ-loop domain-containing transporter [Mycoplasmoidaceae bacterium]|nr:PQ-loop domain-containing transporter [Mycoplasmoidaceae bacterium]
MPQVIKTVKTRNTVGISLAMFIIVTAGDTFFAISGIGMLAKHDLAGGIPLFLANIVSGTSCAIVLFFKARNLR